VNARRRRRAARPAGTERDSAGPLVTLAVIRGQARLGILAALMVTAVVVVCLIRLEQRGAISWALPVVLPLLILGAVAMSLFAILLRTYGGRISPGIAVILVAGVLLLSVIGMLVRLSLGARDASAWSQPLIGALGILALFVSIEVVLRYRPGSLAFAATIATAVAIVAVQVADRPRHAAVPPGAPADWSTPPLVLVLLGLLAFALTTGLPQARGWSARLLAQVREWVDMGLLRLALPALIALALFAFTRNLGAAIALLCGGAGVLVGTRRDRASMARLPAVFGLLAGLLAVFVAGAWVLTIVGTSLFRDAGFGVATVLAKGRPYPIALLNHHPKLVGAGFGYRRVGPAGAGQAILSVIGRETGFLGLIGIGLLFIGLLGCLLWLACRQEPRSFGSAWTFGVAGMLFGQVLMAALTLLRVLPPFAPGAPLLAGGAAWYLATLIAVGIAVGCSCRPSRPSVESAPG
jgi:hypothetical protein